MSLRTKALAAVLLLVSAVTGGLLLFVRERFAARTEQAIEEELAVDGQRLRDILRSTRDEKQTALNAVMAQDQLELIILAAQGIRGNFESKASDWKGQTGSDGCVVALDAYLAKPKGATALWETSELWVVAADHGPDRSSAAALRDATAFMNLLLKAFRGVRPASAVLPVGDGLVLAVATPLFRTPSQAAEFARLVRVHAGIPEGDPAWETMLAETEMADDLDVIGVTAIMVDLSSAWTRANRPRRPAAAGPRGTASAHDENQIHQVLYAASGPAAASFDRPGDARTAVDAARIAAGRKFKIPLALGGFEETFIGRAQNFEGDGFDPSRPGLIALKSYDRELEPLHLLVRQVTVFAAAIGVLGSIAAYGLAWVVIRRLGALQAAAERVKRGDFTTAVTNPGRDEIGALGIAFNNMTKGLQALGLYTDSVLARSVIDNPELLTGKATRREGTILFTDIRDFTAITERQDAVALTTQLNQYFTAIGEHVKTEKGYLDKFIGDAVMAFWGEPFTMTADYALRACRAALLARRAIADLREVWKSSGQPLFFQRMGIATGEVVVGNIGSQTKKNFTVIGDSVNLASRLEVANKIYGTEILVDERTRELAGPAVVAREIDEIAIRGKEKPVRVYELLGMADDPSPRALRLIDLYGKALAAWRRGDLPGAQRDLASLLSVEPEDGPARWLQGRCSEGGPRATSVTRTW
ncbi:MAG: adenylate/guanylate cyclase domain-containing protein [Candidatus Brocadiae bacterium]|nr:adenylate/guanylate cyclase domain-containing protein [Candidatus Brocadiia bacterium]